MTERFVCTKDNPWKLGDDRAQHPNAEFLRSEYDQTANHDDYEVYKCPNCDLTFEVTLPN